MDPTNLNNRELTQIELNLSRKDIAEYKQYHFVLGFHRLSINDLSANASQPFIDPISNKLIKYPILRNRPQRHLICNGEVYNYQELKELRGFIDKDLSSDCDIQLILADYIYHMEKKMNFQIYL